METNWNAMTALATLSMTIATLAVAVIALQAKDTWKEKIKQEKKYELTVKLKTELEKFNNNLIPLSFLSSLGSDERKTKLKNLQEIFVSISEIKKEFEYIEEAVILKSLEPFISDVNVYGPRFKEDEMPLAFTDDEIINNLIKQSLSDEINSIIRAIQKTCDEEIKKFYTK